jgi:hypothetical protein
MARRGTISRKSWRASTVLWLNGCAPEIFAKLTAEDVARRGGFKLHEAEELLARARSARG